MQIFEAVEINEFPYMETREITSGEKVRDVLTKENEDRVFLLVDHDGKRIWTYNGNRSPFKLQIYGGILATELRKQLKLFYRIFSLNIHSKDSKEFQEVMDKLIGGGRALPITKDSFSAPISKENITGDLSVHPGLNANKAIEMINELPKLNNYERRSLIIGNNIYSDEEITESFLKKEKIKSKTTKLGPINRGFMFFGDVNYSTRLIIKERKVQGLELFVKSDLEETPLELHVPLIQEEKLSRKGDLGKIIEAFKIPEKLPEEESQ